MTHYYTILLEPTAETGYSKATVHSIWKNEELANTFAELHRAAYPEWRATVEDTPICDEEDLKLLSAMMDDNEDNPIVDDYNVKNQL